MTKAYVALGANLGHPQEALQAALEDLRQTAGVDVMVVSSFYRTAPVESSGPDYVNAVAEVETTLEASELLHVFQRIENAHGRVYGFFVSRSGRRSDGLFVGALQLLYDVCLVWASAFFVGQSVVRRGRGELVDCAF